MPTISKSSIEKLSEQINQIATRLDPNANRELILIVDQTLPRLLPDTWRDRVLERHYELRPFDRNSFGKVTIVVSSVPRCDDHPGPREIASCVLLKELQ